MVFLKNMVCEVWSRKQVEPSVCYLLHAGFLLGLFFNPEDRCNTFLQNAVRLSMDYETSYPRRQNSSSLFLHANIISWHIKKKTPWSESASELYRPSDHRLSAKWLPTFADTGATWSAWQIPTAVFSVFYTRAATFLSSSSSVVLMRLSGPHSRPTTFFLLVVPGIEPGPPDL
jgi:hypothetical protein